MVLYYWQQSSGVDQSSSNLDRRHLLFCAFDGGEALALDVFADVAGF